MSAQKNGVAGCRASIFMCGCVVEYVLLELLLSQKYPSLFSSSSCSKSCTLSITLGVDGTVGFRHEVNIAACEIR